MLDLEGDCAGLSTSAMVSWIGDFSDTYRGRTGRYPLLYTNPSWWSSCTGGSGAFVNTNPLVLARYAGSAGALPGGWPYYTIWQFNDAYKYGGDSDTFNGDREYLVLLIFFFSVLVSWLTWCCSHAVEEIGFWLIH